jgi:hypothetical protein
MISIWLMLGIVGPVWAQSWETWISAPIHNGIVIEMPRLMPWETKKWWNPTTHAYEWVAKAGLAAGELGALKTVDSLVKLTVGPSKLKILGRVALEVGFMAGSMVFADWLNEQTVELWQLEPDGKTVTKQGTATTYEPSATAQGVGPMSGCSQDGSYLEGVMPYSDPFPQPWEVYAWGGYGWGAEWYQLRRNVWGPNCNTGSGYETWRWHIKFAPFPQHADWVTGTVERVMVTASEVEMAFEAALAANNPKLAEALADAMDKVNEGVNNATKTWPVGEKNYTPMDATAGAAAHGALNDSLTPAQIAELQGKAGTDPNLPPPPATLPGEQAVRITGQDGPVDVRIVDDEGQPKPEDWEYTPEEIAAAQKSAIWNDGAWNVTPEVDPENPEKKNLTEKLITYMDAIGDIEALNVLDGLVVQANGGTSTLCVSLPGGAGLAGGQSCYDFAPWGPTINMIGAILLALTWAFSVIDLFKGR